MVVVLHQQKQCPLPWLWYHLSHTTKQTLALQTSAAAVGSQPSLFSGATMVSAVDTHTYLAVSKTVDGPIATLIERPAEVVVVVVGWHPGDAAVVY